MNKLALKTIFVQAIFEYDIPATAFASLPWKFRLQPVSPVFARFLKVVRVLEFHPRLARAGRKCLRLEAGYGYRTQLSEPSNGEK